MTQHPREHRRTRRIVFLLLAVLLFAAVTGAVLRNAAVVTTRVDRDSAWMQTLDVGRLALEVNDPRSPEVTAAIALLLATSTDIAAEPGLAESSLTLGRTVEELRAALATGVGQTEARTRVLRAIGDVETGIWQDHAAALAGEQRARVQLLWFAIVAVLVAGLAALAASTAHRRRLRAEELGRQLEGALESAETARRAADAASQAKSQFLATISHEIRTPMMAIVGMGELLELTELDERQRRYLRTIDASSAALMALIGDVLDLSRIEAGTLELTERPFELEPLVVGVGLLFEDAASRKGLRFHADIDGELPARVKGDETRVRQILVNFVGNAVKFTAEGQVELRVRAGGDGMVRFEVADTGPGLPEGYWGLFEPFSQGDGSSTRRHGGAGLGLAICREIVETMGGQIGVTSTAGEGCCFYAELPLSPVEEPRPPDMPPSLSPPVGSRVLVVDDNADARTVISSMLGASGYAVSTAASGEAALEMALAARYDLILMDCDMPGMDGLETTEALRSSGGDSADTPVVGLSGHVLEAARARGLAAGMNDYLGKPLRRAELIDAVSRWTGVSS